MQAHSSGTQVRYRIPEICPYCDTESRIETLEFSERGHDWADARVKCTNCNRVWYIPATPIWELLQ